MSTVFESISLKGLRKAHLQQLLNYIEDRDREGWYYGNKDQFEKRHIELKQWAKNACEYAYSDDVVLPRINKK